MRRRGQSTSQAQLLRVLTACQGILWSCKLPSAKFSCIIPPQLWRTRPLQQPRSLHAALRFVHPDDRHEVVARARLALLRRTPYVQHLRLVLEEASAPIWMECHGTVCSDDKGAPALLEGVLVGISAHRKTLEALEEADRRKDAFMATLAHELRNPLTAIGAVVQLLSIRTVDATQLKTCIDMIRRQTRQLSRLAEDMLDLTRVVRDELTFRREPIYLRDSLEAAIEATQEALQTHGHSLQVILPERQVRIDADPVRLGQLFGNLLGNAIKYTPDGGSIRLMLDFEGSWARVCICDSGIGISAEHLPHVFEPFYRAASSLARTQEGLGIGLALCHRIALLHGGSIAVRSAGLGQGCEVEVRLPLLPAAGDVVHSGASEHAAAPRALRVLIAEDNADVANALALALRASGHEVRTVLDGEAALAMAERMHPQVALLDIDMPKRTGQEVAAQIRTRSWAAQPPVLLAGLTGWNSHELGGIDLSVFDTMVIKPPRIEEIQRLIEIHVSRAGGVAALASSASPDSPNAAERSAQSQK